MTRSDANDLVAQLVSRGRQQTDQLLSDVERLIGRGREQLESGEPWLTVERVDRSARPQCRPGPPLGRSRSVVPDPRLRRPDLRPGPSAPRGPRAGRAAQGARVRAAARQPQIGPRGDRQDACSPLARPRRGRCPRARGGARRSATATSVPSTSCSGCSARPMVSAAQRARSFGVRYRTRACGGRPDDGTGGRRAGDELSSTGPATAAIARAGREASMRDRPQLGTEHMLLALVREPAAPRRGSCSSSTPIRWPSAPQSTGRREGLRRRAACGCHARTNDGTCHRPHHHREPPRPGRDLELTVDSLAYGGAGVARLDGYVVFVPDGDPRRPRARRRAEAPSAPMPRPGRSRCSSQAPTGSRRWPRIPGAPWQVLPYERQLEVKHAQVDDALRRIGRLDGFELEPIVPADRAVALPQQARVLVRHRRRPGGSCAAFTRRAAGRRSRGDRLPARLRGRQCGARAGASSGAARRGCPRMTGAPARASCATWSCGRAAGLRRAAGAARDEPGAARHARASPRAADGAVDGLLWTQPTAWPRRPGRRDRADRRHASDSRRRSAACACASPASAFFQTNTEMAERLYELGDRVRRSPAAPIASTTCTAGSARSAC